MKINVDAQKMNTIAQRAVQLIEALNEVRFTATPADQGYQTQGYQNQNPFAQLGQLGNQGIPQVSPFGNQGIPQGGQGGGGRRSRKGGAIVHSLAAPLIQSGVHPDVAYQIAKVQAVTLRQQTQQTPFAQQNVQTPFGVPQQPQQSLWGQMPGQQSQQGLWGQTSNVGGGRRSRRGRGQGAQDFSGLFGNTPSQF